MPESDLPCSRYEMMLFSGDKRESPRDAGVETRTLPLRTRCLANKGAKMFAELHES